MKLLCIIASILLIVGGLNWGLIGLVNLNLVELIFGGTGVDRTIYILVGLAAVLQCFCFKQVCGKGS